MSDDTSSIEKLVSVKSSMNCEFVPILEFRVNCCDREKKRLNDIRYQWCLFTLTASAANDLSVEIPISIFIIDIEWFFCRLSV